MENKINIACFKEGSRTAEVKGIWQWDYGQILRIQGLNLPTAVEIHFSLDERGGEALRRIGITQDGVTDVVIPDSMVENESAYGDSYYFFAYIYLTDETSGNTEYKIRAKVSTRSKPEGYNSGDSTFAAILKTVNEIAEDKVDIPVPAKVGQVIAVSEVDEYGNPVGFQATDPGGGVSDEKIAEAVGDYLTAHPIEESDPTVPDWAKQPKKPSYTAEEVGALPNTTTTLPNPNALTFTGAATGSYDGSSPIEINIPEGGGTGVTVDTTLSVAGQAADAKTTGDAISSLSEEIANKTGTGLSTEVINKLEEVGNYLAYATADGGSKWTELIAILRNGSSGSGSGETVTLQSISATYSGSDVAVGTALTDLTDITVTAHYSDGSTANVTDYTLSGEIAEGSNTITVSYGSKTTTFTVTGVAEVNYVELSNSADLWEIGGVQPQGTAQTNTARLMTIATLSDDVKKISVDDGYSYILVVYSEAQTEVPTDTNTVLLTGKGYYNPNGIAGDVTVDNGFLTSVGAYFSGEMIISEVRANINSMYGNTYGDRAHFRILLKNNDNTTLTADDGLHIHLWG